MIREPKKTMTIVLDSLTLAQANSVWEAIQDCFCNNDIESDGGYDLIDFVG